jgi:hypothetical protein
MESLRSLESETVRQELKSLLTKSEIDGILARRDLIVKHFDGKTSASGGGEVLYDFLLSSPKPLSLAK